MFPDSQHKMTWETTCLSLEFNSGFIIYYKIDYGLVNGSECFTYLSN